MTTLTETPLPTGTWTVDPAHSSVEFRVKHLALASFKGRFTDIHATITDGRIEGTVPVESVSVKVPDLKGHLLSPDFFDAERHPEIRFVSTDVRSDGAELVVDGELTIKGVTQTVEARGSISGPGPNAAGQEAIGLELETVVDRNTFGVSWNADLPNGTKVLADEVKLVVELELVNEA